MYAVYFDSEERGRERVLRAFFLSSKKRDSAFGRSDFFAAEKVTKKPPKPTVLESLFRRQVLSDLLLRAPFTMRCFPSLH